MNTELFMPITTNLLVPLLTSTYDVVMPLFFAYLGLFYFLFGRGGGGREALVYNVFHLVGSLLVGRLFPPGRGKRSLHLATLTMMAVLCEIFPLAARGRGFGPVLWESEIYIVQISVIVCNWVFLYLTCSEEATDGVKSLINFTHLLLLLQFYFDYKLFTILFILYPLILNIWFDSFPNKLSISP